MGFITDHALEAIESTRSNRIEIVMYALSMGTQSTKDLVARRAARNYVRRRRAQEEPKTKERITSFCTTRFCSFNDKMDFIICEARRDHLVGESDGESPLSLILALVRAHLNSSEAEMSLHNAVCKLGTSKFR